MAASVAALTVLSFTADGQELNLKPPASSTVVSPLGTPVINDSLLDNFVIEGVIRNEKGEIIQAAQVEVTSQGILISRAITNEDGEFKIYIAEQNVVNNDLAILIRAPDYINELVELGELSGKKKIELGITMNAPKKNVGSPRVTAGPIMIINRYSTPLIDKDNPGSKTTITAPQLEKMPH